MQPCKINLSIFRSNCRTSLSLKRKTIQPGQKATQTGPLTYNDTQPLTTHSDTTQPTSTTGLLNPAELIVMVCVAAV